jgi:hypothetical protein
MFDYLDEPKEKKPSGKEKDILSLSDKEKRHLKLALHLKKASGVIAAQLKSITDYFNRKVRNLQLERENPFTSTVVLDDSLQVGVSDKYRSPAKAETKLLEEVNIPFHDHFGFKDRIIIDLDLISKEKQEQLSWLFDGLLSDRKTVRARVETKTSDTASPSGAGLKLTEIPTIPKEAFSRNRDTIVKPGFHQERWKLGEEINREIEEALPLAISVKLTKKHWEDIPEDQAINTATKLINRANTTTTAVEIPEGGTLVPAETI